MIYGELLWISLLVNYFFIILFLHFFTCFSHFHLCSYLCFSLFLNDFEGSRRFEEVQESTRRSEKVRESRRESEKVWESVEKSRVSLLCHVSLWITCRYIDGPAVVAAAGVGVRLARCVRFLLRWYDHVRSALHLRRHIRYGSFWRLKSPKKEGKQRKHMFYL